MAARPRGTGRAKIVQVIETISLLGAGIEGDPCRYATSIGTLKEICWQKETA